MFKKQSLYSSYFVLFSIPKILFCFYFYHSYAITFFKTNSFHSKKMCMFVCQNFCNEKRYN